MAPAVRRFRRQPHRDFRRPGSHFLFKGETDYVRKKGDKKDPQLPEPYDNKLDWSKAKVVQQLPCGFAKNDHTCVIVEAPMKAWMRPGLPGEVTKMLDGKAS
jgi:hypothetical protein